MHGASSRPLRCERRRKSSEEAGIRERDVGRLSNGGENPSNWGHDMQLEIRGRDIYVSHALRAHIERRLRFALNCFASRISKVRVKLEDLNGPRGGIDKCCQLAISLAPSSRIVMEDRASSVYTAIDRVAAKAGCYIGRRLKRPNGRSPLRRTRELLL